MTVELSAPGAPADPSAAAPAVPPAWSCSVSVRSLCEFTAKRGDLDRRFTPSATALEGQQGQAAVTLRRGPAYESEVALEGFSGELRVRGRADGFDPIRGCLEEIKTIRGGPEDIPENRRALHWAQLQTYGALLCRDRGLPALTLALVYVDAASLHETVQRVQATAAELDAAFELRCGQYRDWARQEAAHRRERDEALAALPFPPGDFRPGQRALSEAVYRGAVNRRCLLAQAPTGIGKTLGTLFPLLRAMPAAGIDKIGYLTCKTTGRITALEALEPLREHTPGRRLRVLTLVAREQACEHPEAACHGESCVLARGFYDRLPAARAEAVAAGWLDPPALRRIALSHGICPYYLGQELMRWADVVVGDVHHAFDPNGALFALAQAQEWRLALLVDEAHNLVERTRAMYSVQTTLAQVRSAMQLAPPGLRGRFRRWLEMLGRLAAEGDDDYRAIDEVPDGLAETLQGLVAGLADHLQKHPLATGPLLDFHFQSLALQRLLERFGPHSVFDVQREAAADDAPPQAATPLLPGLGPEPEASFSLRNVVPAGFLRPRFAACHAVTLFSATLGPPEYPRDLLGLPEDTGWIDVPPPFPPEHLVVRIADRLSTRYPHRQASLDAVVALMARQYREAPGNYLAFFSSFEYLTQAAERLALRHPELPQWRQSRAMDEASRRAFLDRFVPGGRGIAFAVLGGAFAEGVDLPGTRLIGAFVATLGLPPVSPVQEQFRARLDAMFGAEHGYADRVPALQKVVQAAGRVLRSPEDRGWLWLMDERYRRREIRALLPCWWRIG